MPSVQHVYVFTHGMLMCPTVIPRGRLASLVKNKIIYIYVHTHCDLFYILKNVSLNYLINLSLSFCFYFSQILTQLNKLSL